MLHDVICHWDFDVCNNQEHRHIVQIFYVISMWLAHGRIHGIIKLCRHVSR